MMKTGSKRIILLGDGMPDEPIDELGGKTPLQAANCPNMDRMAREGTVGAVQTVPEGYEPGSDITNMGILGYDPGKYYTGRAPLEAAGMGIGMSPGDIAYRCNLVTLLPGRETVVMEDFSADHIETGEAEQLINALNEYFGDGDVKFYPGVSYRNLMIWENGSENAKTTPPHDITGQGIKEFLPTGIAGQRLRTIIGEAQIVLKQHKVNKKRKSAKKGEANSIWLWGQGKAPSMPSLKESRSLTGAMISAVDLMNGLGALTGMEVIKVEGATGYIDTNYEGKAAAAINALREKDLVYLHLEAPDEAAHSGSLENKIRAIEDFDKKIVGVLMEEVAALGGRAVVLSDHATPLRTRTHTSQPVPFAVWPAFGSGEGGNSFDESLVDNPALFFAEARLLFEKFIE